MIKAILLIGIATIIGAFGAICFKKGVKNTLVENIKSKFIYFGFALYGSSSIIYIIALHGNELSKIYPLVSLGYIWTILLSYLILKEKITKFKWISISLIILGIILISL